MVVSEISPHGIAGRRGEVRPDFPHSDSQTEMTPVAGHQCTGSWRQSGDTRTRSISVQSRNISSSSILHGEGRSNVDILSRTGTGGRGGLRCTTCMRLRSVRSARQDRPAWSASFRRARLASMSPQCFSALGELAKRIIEPAIISKNITAD